MVGLDLGLALNKLDVCGTVGGGIPSSPTSILTFALTHS